MEVYIDEQLFAAEEFSEGTIEETVRNIQGKHCPEGTLIVGLSCDGQEVPSGAMTETMGQDISTIERLDLITANYRSLIMNTMDEASESLRGAIVDGKRIASMLVSGQTIDALRELGDCVRVFQQVHDAIGKSLQILEVDLDSVGHNGESVIASLAKPREVLMDIKGALQNTDHVRLADILEYEMEQASVNWESIIERIRTETAISDESQSATSEASDAIS